MSHVGLFVYGAVVSLLVVAAFGLMVWASIEDGREQEVDDGSRLATSTGAPVPITRTVHLD